MDSNATASLLRTASRSSGRGSQAPESRTQRGNISIYYKSSFFLFTNDEDDRSPQRVFENEPLNVATA